MILLPLALGALLQSVIVAATSPRGPAAKQWPAWSLVVVSMGMFVFAAIFGSFGKGGSLEAAPWFGLVFAGLGLGIGLRLTGRLPIVNEGIVLSLTSLYVYLTFATHGGTLRLASAFIPIFTPLALVSVAAIAWLAVTTKPAPRWLKYVLYAWYLAATAELAFFTVFMGVLPDALATENFFALTLAAMLLCGFVAQMILLIMTLYGWIARSKYREAQMRPAGWVPDSELFANRFTDDQMRWWQAIALAALPPLALLANAALHVASEDTMVGIILVSTPILSLRRGKREPTALTLVDADIAPPSGGA